MIDLDALKAELEAAGLDPSGSWREWLVVGNITAYRRGAVYMSPGVEIDQQDFKALAIIARHVAPVVTPEPDVLPPEVEAALNASLREHRAIYQQLADTPEPDAEVRDVLAEAIRITPHGALGDGPNAYDRTADAGLAALRDKGFAVVRTADVEPRTCAGCKLATTRVAGETMTCGLWGAEVAVSFSCAAWEAKR